jgi:hypothetical protein
MEPTPLEGAAVDAFFILSLFLPGGWPRAEDANHLRSLGEEEEEQTASSGMADDGLPRFSGRVLLISEDGSYWIIEDAFCLLEADTVLSVVGSRLLLILLNPHGSIKDPAWRRGAVAC